MGPFRRVLAASKQFSETYPTEQPAQSADAAAGVAASPKQAREELKVLEVWGLEFGL